MAKKGLIIGIDYSDQYCQVCYYSNKHQRAESVTAGTDVMRYLIPTVVCFNYEHNDWMIGNPALQYAEKTGAHVFQNLMQKIIERETILINDIEYSYSQLLAIYFGKLLEYVQIRTSVMGVKSITVTMRKVDRDVKEILENVFQIININPSDIRLLSYAESYAYFMINEDPELWKNGALLFDFTYEGFFAKLLTVSVSDNQPLVYVNENNYSIDFSMRDLASEVLQVQLDRKLSAVFHSISDGAAFKSVFFTGEGFDELWFGNTLNEISETKRAFKGNNIYVKGACIAGNLKASDENIEIPIFCKGRTKADISVEARVNGQQVEIKLSKAATDWYDAGSAVEFILENEKTLAVYITSLVSKERNYIEFDLSEIPERPVKNTRIELEVRYLNDFECEITVRDKGFGEFFESSNVEIKKYLNLDGFI